MIETTTLQKAALDLHGYIAQTHAVGGALVGPDTGVRFNARIGRFVKSYFPKVNFGDDYVYIQGQAYWIMANWQLATLTGDNRFVQIAIDCTNNLLALQQPDGAWPFANPEWKGRVPTVEGCFGAIGLMTSYEQTGNAAYLQGAERWAEYMQHETGYQQFGDGFYAVNYFAGQYEGRVPNNATLAVQMLARLRQLTGSLRYDAQINGMVAWLTEVQLVTGELPYMVASNGVSDRIHFLCYQYNAFEFIDLAHYYRMTGDPEMRPVLANLAEYLSHGLTESGAARYNCDQETPIVTYYAAAIAYALSLATMLRLDNYSVSAERGFQWILSQQRTDGGFHYFSTKNYGILTDRRSYPRNVAMILHHLLAEITDRKSPPPTPHQKVNDWFPSLQRLGKGA